MKRIILILAFCFLAVNSYAGLSRLHEEIESAGVPIRGVSGAQGAVGIDFKPEATPAQITQAFNIAAAHDWSASAENTWLQNKEPLLKDARDVADQAVTDIDTYLVIADSATNAQVRAEVKAIDQRQKKIIKALKRLIQREWML